MTQQFTLSREVIKSLFDLNQMAKQSFDSYYIMPNGDCVPRKINSKIMHQRTIVHSDSIHTLFSELRIDISDGTKSPAILIHPFGVFKGLDKITKIVGVVLEDSHLHVIVEETNSTKKYYEDFSDMENMVSKYGENSYKIFFGKVIENLWNENSSEFVKRYVHEFNSEELYTEESFNKYKEHPLYENMLTKDQVVSVYDKEILQLEVDDLMIIILKPHLHGISKASKVSFSFMRHVREERSFVAYFCLSKSKGINAYHKFEAIDLSST